MAPHNLIYVNNSQIKKHSHPKTLICKHKQVENKLKVMEIKIRLYCLWGLINNETRWFSFECVIKTLPFKELIISPNLHMFVQNIMEDNVIEKN